MCVGVCVRVRDIKWLRRLLNIIVLNQAAAGCPRSVHQSSLHSVGAHKLGTKFIWNSHITSSNMPTRFGSSCFYFLFINGSHTRRAISKCPLSVNINDSFPHVIEENCCNNVLGKSPRLSKSAWCNGVSRGVGIKRSTLLNDFRLVIVGNRNCVSPVRTI